MPTRNRGRDADSAARRALPRHGRVARTAGVSPPPVDWRAVLELPLFRDVAPAALAAVAAHLRVEEHPKGAWLFRRGDPGDALYVVMSGLVLLERELDGRRQ